MTTPTDVFIYVSPTGKDWNPGTQTMPVQTLSKALSLVPLGYFEKCRIILAPGTYTEASPINMHLPNPVGPNAIDLAIVGEMRSVLGDRTCTATDTTNLVYTDASLTLAPDAFVGATLYCVSGMNKEASRTIVSNTATALTINKPWASPPTLGDVFQVQQPAVVINHVGIAIWGPGPFVGLQYLKIAYIGTDSTRGLSAAFLVKFVAESVDMDLGGGVFALFHYCGINPGAELAGLFPGSGFSLLRQADWFIHDGMMSLTNRCQVPNSNNLVAKNLSIACADSCTLAPLSIFGSRTDISLTTCSSFNHAGIPGHPSVLRNSNGANNYLIKADKNSIVGGGNAGIRRIALDNSGRDAILLQGNSHGYIGDVTGMNPLGVGINCESMSTARVNQGGTTTVTGTADVSIGGITKQYVGPPGLSIPFTNGNTLCRIE